MSSVSASIAWYWRMRATRAAISSAGPIDAEHALADGDGDVVGVERALGREQPVAALVLLADDQRLHRRAVEVLAHLHLDQRALLLDHDDHLEAAREILEMVDVERPGLTGFVYHSGLLMQPIFTAAKKEPKRIVYAEGEDERVLRAVQVVVDEKLAKPILVGRPAVLARRIERFGLRLKPDVDFETINPEFDERYRDYWMNYYELTQRKGVSQPYAQVEMRRRHTLIGAMMIHRGDADGMICGTFGTHALHLHFIDQVIGRRPGAAVYAAMNAILLPARTVFIADTYVNADPTPEQIGDIAVMAADEIRRFGLTPKVALLSHSSFGTSRHACAQKMRDALALIQRKAPDLEIDGEMHGDAALSEAVRRSAFPNSKLVGEANLLIMPTLDAANISFNLLKVASGGGVTLGPILLGVAKPAHILTQSATVRRIVNMTALTVVDSTIDRQAQLAYSTSA